MLEVEDDELTFDWPVVFEKSKDKPVSFSALACVDILLTLDRRDSGELLGKTIYGWTGADAWRVFARRTRARVDGSLLASGEAGTAEQPPVFL